MTIPERIGIAARREMDHERPLFYTTTWGATGKEGIAFVDGVLETCSPAVRERFAFLVRHDRELWTDLEKRGIPWMAAADVEGTVEDDWFKEFENIIGVCGSEYPERFGWPAIPNIVKGLTDSGGIVAWQFLFNFGRLFDSDPEIYRFYRENRDRIILEIKANGFPEWWSPVEDGRCRFGRFIHYSEVMSGAWLTGLASNWGIHPEMWQWFEIGYYSRLFDYSLPGTRFRCEVADPGMCNTVFHNVGLCNYPENLMAQELLNAAIHGCAVFSFEHGSGHGIDRYAVMPMLNEIAARGLIPSREEVLHRTRAAVWTGEATRPNMDHPEAFWPGSFRRLYATTALVLQNNGRYGLIPSLPKHTPAEERKRFECFPAGYHYTHLPFLNALYPEEGKGRCFIERHGSRWYVFNPYENVDKEADFELPLYSNTCRSLSGRLGVHSLAIVEEHTDRIEIYLSNYRVRKDEFWERRHEILKGDDFADTDGLLSGGMSREEADAAGRRTREEMHNRLKALPLMANARNTVLVLDGHAGPDAPGLDIEGHEGCRHRQEWRDHDGIYELNVEHNGVVRITLAASGDHGDVQPPAALSHNLTLDRAVRVSSAAPAHGGGGAVDGFHDTWWTPDETGRQWISVDLERETAVSAYKIVGETETPTTVELQVGSTVDGPWTSVHSVEIHSRFFRVFPVDVADACGAIRLLIPSPAKGFALREFGIYAGPNDELKIWMPLTEPASVAQLLQLFDEATSDAERDAIEAAIRDFCADNSDRDAHVREIIAAPAGADELTAASLIRLLGALGGDRALAAVRAATEDARAEVREAANWALVHWPDAASFDDVLNVARTARDLSLRAHALRRLLPVVRNNTLSEDEKDRVLAEGIALATEGKDRLAWIRAASGSGSVEVLRAVVARMDDPLDITWFWGPAREAASAIAEKAGEAAREALEKMPEVPPAPADEAVAGPADGRASPIRWTAYRPASCDIRRAEFGSLSPIAQGTVNSIAPRGFLNRRRGSGLWIRFEGVLHAPRDGAYGFALRSDRYAVLSINGTDVTTSSSGKDGLVTIQLPEGPCPVIVKYVRGPLETLALRWLPPAPGRAVDEAMRCDAADGLPFGRTMRVMEDIPPEAWASAGPVEGHSAVSSAFVLPRGQTWNAGKGICRTLNDPGSS